MNRLARKGLVSAMVAGGVLASAGYAQADAAAEGDTAGSPGVLSGNSVEVPVHVPVNVCGDTINVVGLLNPVSGNACANRSSSATSSVSGTSGASGSKSAARPARHAGAAADESAAAAGSRSGGGAHAAGSTHGSPGVLSGNGLLLPVDLPLNVSGNSVNVVGIGNPSFGNTAVNDDAPPAPPAHAPIPAPPADLPEPVSPAAPAAPTLAHTGAEGVGTAVGGSLALLLGGTVLYRRARATARR
nr:chaplin [Streptomyces sp. NBC_00899]WSX80558.1 chaplin [Streptomyces sp. NBC_00899]